MKTRLNFKFLTLIILILIVTTNDAESKSISQDGGRRNTTGQDAFSNITTSNNNNNNNNSNSDNKNKNSTSEMRILPSTSISENSIIVQHINRNKRETAPDLPFDFYTTHLPCDLDFNGRWLIIDKMPNHCIWLWNNRYVHEGFYRVYKIYQLEAFTFGQYYERLKRYEINPHVWYY